ncbi:hypothetical protein GYMLUDRAFT_262366 [Collybiopsis luxurians FD-317 M1]|uniref:PCI domain-containing protein n=1 Tax=Collybiopsis luxurians FD-317 M1 TaxID=944289 RepID=A0A0D0BTQ6_9AGAR|nr:hypothetical protein GYMLUDRAFT_262366 [Collybiopsis luxurians FD-317 M1]
MSSSASAMAEDWHSQPSKLNCSSSWPTHVDVFERFVTDFESMMNQLRLVKMRTRLTFLTSLLSQIDKETSPETYILFYANIARAKLLDGDLEGTKAEMDEAWKILDSLESVKSSVNAAYYGVAVDHYKALNQSFSSEKAFCPDDSNLPQDYAPYYRNSLLYLACVDPASDMTAEDRLGRAHDIVHPILDALDGTNFEGIEKLLFTVNEGSIGKFEALAPLLPQEPILQENYAFLRQNICLMALIESVFKRSANNRTMSFKTIAEETRLPNDEVEHLVMKALSLKLIYKAQWTKSPKKTQITWVQPRVLSRSQIGDLAKRLEGWVNKLNVVERRIAGEVEVSA